MTADDPVANTVLLLQSCVRAVRAAHLRRREAQGSWPRAQRATYF
jgi:hypothetical protein